MKLIDKNKLLEELKKLKKNLSASPIVVIEDVESLIESLETKEVNLEEEIDKIWNPCFNLGWDEKSLLSMNHEGFTTIAKYFYELGLNAKGD